MNPTFDSTLAKLVGQQDLSHEEAYSAMTRIMSGEVSPVKLSAWLTALKIKGEKPGEISGCAAAMAESALPVGCDDPDAVDTCGTGGDGGRTFNVSTAAALVVAGAGITVAKHGNRSVSGKCGSADVLEALGVKIPISPGLAEKCLREAGIAFLFAPAYHPAMKHAMPVRKELGMRTIFNILGPLCNPARVKRAIVGVYEKRLCLLVAEAALKLGYRKMLVLHGDDGLDEISLCAKTHVCEIRNGKIVEYEFDPAEHGFRLRDHSEIAGGTSVENARSIMSILDGSEKGPRLDIVVLNSAAAIIASGKTDRWDAAMGLARESVAGGRALAKLDLLRTMSQEKISGQA